MAPNPWRSGGSCCGSAGSAGISISFRIAHEPFSLRHSQMEAERSFNETTTPRKPNARVGGKLREVPRQQSCTGDFRRRANNGGISAPESTLQAIAGILGAAQRHLALQGLRPSDLKE